MYNRPEITASLFRIPVKASQQKRKMQNTKREAKHSRHVSDNILGEK